MATTPQDHLAPKTERLEEAQKALSQIEGNELLKPLKELPAIVGLELFGAIQAANRTATLRAKQESKLAGENVEPETRLDDMLGLLEIINNKCVANPEGWEQFATAANTTAVLELSVAYAMEMGKEIA